MYGFIWNGNRLLIFITLFSKYQLELWVCGTTLTPTTDMIYKLLRVFGVQREPMVQVKFSSRSTSCHELNVWVKCDNSLRLLSCLHTVKLLNFIFMTYMCVKNITTASKAIWFYLSQPPQLFIWIRKTFLHSNNIIWSNCATTFFSSYLIFFTKWIKLKKW